MSQSDERLEQRVQPQGAAIPNGASSDPEVRRLADDSTRRKTGNAGTVLRRVSGGPCGRTTLSSSCRSIFTIGA
jgi:hypothetical protein